MLFKFSMLSVSAFVFVERGLFPLRHSMWGMLIILEKRCYVVFCRCLFWRGRHLAYNAVCPGSKLYRRIGVDVLFSAAWAVLGAIEARVMGPSLYWLVSSFGLLGDSSGRVLIAVLNRARPALRCGPTYMCVPHFCISVGWG